MAKVLRVAAVVVGAVALAATGIGLAVGAGTFLGIAGSTFTTIGAVAGVAGGVLSLGAQLLTKPPPARGSVTELIIDPNAPSPYCMGEGFFAGVLRHRAGYGPTIDDVPNPYLFLAVALCVAGPIAGPVSARADFAAPTSWYTGFLDHDSKLGAVPETALVQKFGSTPPNWGSDYELSGTAAIAWSAKFDPKGKRFASGLPQLGVEAKWVKVYDPRLDDTRAGGVGDHRIDDESTWEWSENPALHAGTYAYGRYHPTTGNRIMGIGLPDAGIDWEAIAAWAEDCDANGWTMFGVVFEGAENDQGRRWANLRDICIAGGAEPLFSGAVLGFHWVRPRVSLATITDADLAEGTHEVTAMQSYRDRLNAVRPVFMDPASNWELVPAELVKNATYLTEDGEPRAEQVPFNFVKDVDQAAQLAAYWMADGRELSGSVTLKPEYRNLRPGECIHLEIAEMDLDHDVVILKRQLDPVTMNIRIQFISDTAAKHAYALGLSGVSPPSPSLTQTAQERDEAAALTSRPPGFAQTLIRTVSFRNPRDASDTARKLLRASESGGSVTISVAKVDVDYSGEEDDVTFAVEDITTLNDGTTPIGFETLYYPYFDYNPLDPATAPVYGLTTDPLAAQNSTTNPIRHALGFVTTPASGSGDTSDGDGGAGDGGGLEPNKTFDTPP